MSVGPIVYIIVEHERKQVASLAYVDMTPVSTVFSAVRKVVGDVDFDLDVYDHYHNAPIRTRSSCTETLALFSSSRLVMTVVPIDCVDVTATYRGRMLLAARYPRTTGIEKITKDVYDALGGREDFIMTSPSRPSLYIHGGCGTAANSFGISLQHVAGAQQTECVFECTDYPTRKKEEEGPVWVRVTYMGWPVMPDTRYPLATATVGDVYAAVEAFRAPLKGGFRLHVGEPSRIVRDKTEPLRNVERGVDRCIHFSAYLDDMEMNSAMDEAIMAAFRTTK